MTDRDALQRATKELRSAYPGAKVGAGFTRARVMRSLHERKRRRLSWWLTLGPALLLALGGTAWGHATGRLPELWHRATALFVANGPATSGTAIRERDKPKPRAARPAAPSAAAASGAQTKQTDPELDQALQRELEAELAAEELAAEQAAAEQLAAEQEAATRRAEAEREARALARARLAADRQRQRQSVVNAAPPAPEEVAPEEVEAPPPRDPELAAFRAGHDLHFKKGNPAQALAAYQRYLSRYPSGRFVPEARYNSALNLLKLGRRDEARRLLSPFAEGGYGGYRQAQATALLRALEPSPEETTNDTPSE